MYVLHAAALIKAGAKLDVADKAGRTPLHLAAERGNGAIIPALAAGQVRQHKSLIHAVLQLWTHRTERLG